MLQPIFNYLKLMRIGNGLIAFFSILATSCIVTQTIELTTPVVLGALAALLVLGGGNSLNDYFDYKIDKMNRPDRPIPSGRISRKAALSFALVLFILGICLGFFLNFLALSVVLVNTALLIVYARYSKSMSFSGNILVAFLTSSVFIFSAVILKTINVNAVVLAVSAFFVMTAREILKDIEDVQGDIDSGASTLPIKLGIKKARAVAIIFVIPAICIVFIPSFLGTMNNLHLGFIVCAVAVLFVSFFLKPKISQRIIKLAVLVVLAGFVLGSL